MADLKKWLAQGANPDDELNDAIVANDVDRVRYLLTHGAHADSHDGDGYTPLISAIRSGFVEVATYLDRAQSRRESDRPQRLDAAHVGHVGRQSRVGQDADCARRKSRYDGQ